jgi:hypothetical protein
MKFYPHTRTGGQIMLNALFGLPSRYPDKHNKVSHKKQRNFIGQPCGQIMLNALFGLYDIIENRSQESEDRR